MAGYRINPGVPPPLPPPPAASRTNSPTPANGVTPGGPASPNGSLSGLGKNARRAAFALGLVSQPIRVGDDLVKKAWELSRRHPKVAIFAFLVFAPYLVPALAILAVPHIARRLGKATVWGVHKYADFSGVNTPRFDQLVENVNQARAIIEQPLATRTNSRRDAKVLSAQDQQRLWQEGQRKTSQRTSRSRAQGAVATNAPVAQSPTPDHRPSVVAAWKERVVEANQQIFNARERKAELTKVYDNLARNVLIDRKLGSEDQAQKTLEAMFGKDLREVIRGIPEDDAIGTPGQRQQEKELLSAIRFVDSKDSSARINPEMAANIAVVRRCINAGPLTKEQSDELSWSGNGYTNHELNDLHDTIDASLSVNPNEVHAAAAQNDLSAPNAANTRAQARNAAPVMAQGL